MAPITKIRLDDSKVLQETGHTLTLSGSTYVTDGDQLFIEGVAINDLLSGGLVVAPEETFTGTTLSLDLNTFNFHTGITLESNITNLIVSGGITGGTYQIILIQGVSGGTLTLGTEWQPSTSYSNGQVVRYGTALYKANQAHTSVATNFRIDSDKWNKYIYFPDGTLPYLGVGEGLRDLLTLVKESDDLYRGVLNYDEGTDGTEGVVENVNTTTWTVESLIINSGFLRDSTNTKTIANLVETGDLNPVVSAVNFLVDGTLSVDLSTVDYLEVTVDANITLLDLSSGILGKEYEIEFKQGATGGTLTLATEWQPSTSYTNEVRLLPDNQVYTANQAHTSAGDASSIDYSNWDIKYRRRGNNPLILSINEGQSDLMKIKIGSDGVASLRMIYA